MFKQSKNCLKHQTVFFIYKMKGGYDAYKKSALVLALGIAVTGCNSDSSKRYLDSSGKLNGTAAVGAAISGGIVEARCKDTSGDNDFIGTVTTDANGKWSAKLKTEATLPCAVRVKWGNPTKTLHSYAYDYGTINITPLTDIILTRAASQKLDDVWFGFGMGSTPTNIAETEVLAAFKEKGYSVPNGSPFTMAFNADHTGWDKLLDEIHTTIPNYADFLQSVMMGTYTIPQAPIDSGSGATGGLVFASFEGMDIGQYSNKPVSGGDTGWKNDWSQIYVVDVSNNPLKITPPNGEEISGGDKAIAYLSNNNAFSTPFENEIYVSILVRVSDPAPKPNVFTQQKLYIGNPALYISLKADNSFEVSIGDKPEEKRNIGNFSHSITYQIVARYYTVDGADNFNRMDYWLNPVRNAGTTPDGTIIRTTNNSGNVKAVAYLGTDMPITNGTETLIDRIVASSTWDGLFTGAAKEPGNGDPTTGNDPLNGKDGATATVNGTAITYAESASWTIGLTRRSSFAAVGSSNTKQWRIVDYMVDTNSPKTQHCGDGVYPLELSFWDGVNAVEATSCTVTIDDYGTYSVSGSFTAVFPKSKVFGSETIISDGYFQKIAQYTNGGGGTLEPGVDGATFKVDGKEFRYVKSRAPDPVSLNSDESYYAVEFDSAFQEQMHPGNPAGMSIKVLPLKAGTYACGYEFTPWRIVQLPFYWKDEHYTATDCSITLTTAEADVFEGSFSGTFKNPSESKTINVTDGKFRASR